MDKHTIALCIILGVALIWYALSRRPNIDYVVITVLLILSGCTSFIIGIIGLMVRIWQLI